MSKCQSVFPCTGEPCSKWQLCCTMVNMVIILHPVLCSKLANYSENSDYGATFIGFIAVVQGTPSPWLPALHITPCLAQGGDYGAAWKSVDYGEAACGPDRSPGWRAGIAGKPPGSDALYRSIDAIRPRHAEHITCLGPQSDIPGQSDHPIIKRRSNSQSNSSP